MDILTGKQHLGVLVNHHPWRHGGRGIVYFVGLFVFMVLKRVLWLVYQDFSLHCYFLLKNKPLLSSVCTSQKVTFYLKKISYFLEIQAKDLSLNYTVSSSKRASLWYVICILCIIMLAYGRTWPNVISSM